MKEKLSHPVAAVEAAFDRLLVRLKSRFELWEPLVVLPFRGYGDGERLWVRGRVLESPGVTGEGGGRLENLVDMVRRYASSEAPGVRVELELAGRRWRVETDEEGYFDLELEGFEPAAVSAPWTEVRVSLCDTLPGSPLPPPTTLGVRVPGANARRGILSDLDDTVVKTGATDLFRHARTVLLNNAGTREPFAGVSAFYRALVDGPGDDEENPIFYVSSSPWNLFDLFEGFLELHEVPLGPILLKDFGVDTGKFFKAGHVPYKAERIRGILDRYPDLRWILVGDNGQRDAEVFAEVASTHHDRLLVAYLRDLRPGKETSRHAEAAARLEEHGVELVLAGDTAVAAAHAHRQGWIDERELEEVRRRVEEEKG